MLFEIRSCAVRFPLRRQRSQITSTLKKRCDFRERDLLSYVSAPGILHRAPAKTHATICHGPAMTTIRPALLSDMGAMTQIYRAAVLHGTASFEIEPPDEAEMQRRWKAVVDAGFPYLVAELADHILGYAYLAAYRPRVAYRWSVEDSIYVAPGTQRWGVGRGSRVVVNARVVEESMLCAVVDVRGEVNSGVGHRTSHVGKCRDQGFVDAAVESENGACY